MSDLPFPHRSQKHFCSNCGKSLSYYECRPIFGGLCRKCREPTEEAQEKSEHGRRTSRKISDDQFLAALRRAFPNRG
jgi:predicted amidophosphoribosyltransferase